MNLETTLAALQHTGHPFPEAAIRWAEEHPVEITPALLDSLKETPAQTMEREPSYFFNVFAMYLLAQFREWAAYQPIIDYHAAITEAEDDLIEGVVTEGLPRMLASLYPGDDAALRRLIEDPGINEWVRGAAVDAYPALLASGQMERSEVVEYFRYLLTRGLEREWSHVWDALALACGSIHPDGLLPLLESAYDADIIDPSYYSPDELRRDAEKTPEQALADAFAHSSPLIDDTVEELSWWACFQPEPEPRPRPEPGSVKAPVSHALPIQGTVNLGPKIGRNDPCPCGSGKKYKKCCLPKGRDFREA